MSTELKTLNGYGFDATKLAGLDAQYYAQGRAAYNLLDNSDFRNPVNQRGKTSYGADGYTIDRWYFYNPNGDGTVTINNGYISLTGGSGAVSLSCRFPKGFLDANKTYTKSICDNLGNINPTSLVFYDSFDSFEISAGAGETKNIVWAALYEGSYDASTLPAYQPKGYAAELAECQRYFIRVSNSAAYGVISVKSCVVKVPLPTTMRNGVTPTATLDSAAWAYTHEGYVGLTFIGAMYSTNTASLHFTLETETSARCCVVPDLSFNINADL